MRTFTQRFILLVITICVVPVSASAELIYGIAAVGKTVLLAIDAGQIVPFGSFVADRKNFVEF